MDPLIDEIMKSLSLVDVAGLVAVIGLALYGATGIGGDDGLDEAGEGDGGGD